jgi:hypothetical protein
MEFLHNFLLHEPNGRALRDSRRAEQVRYYIEMRK